MMLKENLALELVNKHLASLALLEPVFFDAENDLFENSDMPAKSAVVFLPKSKALIDMTLAFVSGKVAEGGSIVLAGEKKGGIESAKKMYEKNIGPVEQKIVGNHSVLYVGKNQRLGAEKKLLDFLSYSKTTYKNVSIEIANLPGVFSAGELDEGTKLLLDHIPYDKKSVLDIGCGAGVIGALYKKLAPENNICDVTMTDSSIIAVEATKKTLEKNSLLAQVFVSDVFTDVAGVFNLIVTNPPFHSGIATDYSFIERFAQGAKKHLAPGGEIYVVANAFLAYRKILEKNIGKTDIVAENGKFTAYRSTTAISHH